MAPSIGLEPDAILMIGGRLAPLHPVAVGRSHRQDGLCVLEGRRDKALGSPVHNRRSGGEAMLDALHSIRGQLAVVYTVLICGLWLYAFVHILRAKAFRQGN